MFFGKKWSFYQQLDRPIFLSSGKHLLSLSFRIRLVISVVHPLDGEYLSQKLLDRQHKQLWKAAYLLIQILVIKFKSNKSPHLKKFDMSIVSNVWYLF